MSTSVCAPTVRVLSWAALLNATGDGVFYVISALYFSQVLGLSAVQVGAMLSGGWALGALASGPVGRIADRAGLEASFRVLPVGVACSLMAVAFVPRGLSLWLAVVAYCVTQSCFTSVRQALIPHLVPEQERVSARSHVQAATNVGIGIGAAVGALVLLVATAPAFRIALAADALSFLLTAAALRRLPSTPDRCWSPEQPQHRRSRGAWADHRFLIVTALNAVMTLYMPMLSVVLPLWIVSRTTAPEWMMPVLFLGNTTGVALLQVRVGKRVKSPEDATRSVRRAGALLAACTLLMAASALPRSPGLASAVLVGAITLQVLGEVHLAAGSWAISYALTPDGRHGEYQGVFGMSVPLARAVGPLCLAGLVLDRSSGAGWALLGAAFALSSLAMSRLAAHSPGG